MDTTERGDVDEDAPQGDTAFRHAAGRQGVVASSNTTTPDKADDRKGGKV